MGQRIEKEEKLRNLWNKICAKPFQKTQDLQIELLEGIRSQECDEKVASSRVNRLKGLGNAVIPEIPETIGRMILEVEKLIERGE
jgi:hypothetical protein